MITEAEDLKKGNSNNIEDEEKIICENIPLVKSIAKRFLNRGVGFEELISVGTVGLIKAVRGFDAEKGFAFSTYAFSLISGEIKSFLRSDGMISVSRELKKHAYTVIAEKEKFFSKYGREATVSELSEICGLTPEQITECVDVLSPVKSLFEPIAAECELTLGDTICDKDEISLLTEKMALNESIAKLSVEEQKLITLRFYKNLTQAQTAHFLGVSQVTVSRMEKRTIEKLKKMLLI